MNKIKNFFEKKKLDSKFKQAGAGQSLSQEKPTTAQPPRPSSSQQRQEPSSGASRAGEAALAR